MLVLTDKSIYLDHIIWQPRFTCARKCFDCYIYDNKEKQNLKKPLNTSILNLINEKLISCDQFTISLDHRDSWSPIDKELVSALYNFIFNMSYPLKSHIKICLSVDSINTFNTWCAILNVSYECILSRIHMLSVSSIGSHQNIIIELVSKCNTNNTIFNYNKLVKNIESTQTKEFELGCRFAHHVNLVLEKKALGGFTNKTTIERRKKLLSIARITARALSKKDNVSLDICCSEKKKFLEKGTACSAGISKLTVWPDGSVTGCPYDVNHVTTEKQIFIHTGQTNTFQEIKTAIYSGNSIQYCKSV